MIALVQLVKADGFAACCSLQPDWKRDQREGDVTSPNAGRHVCCSPRDTHSLWSRGQASEEAQRKPGAELAATDGSELSGVLRGLELAHRAKDGQLTNGACFRTEPGEADESCERLRPGRLQLRRAMLTMSAIGPGTLFLTSTVPHLIEYFAEMQSHWPRRRRNNSPTAFGASAGR
jgi:hypothetical protein